eukprot:258223-Rhodomonas_salina.3
MGHAMSGMSSQVSAAHPVFAFAHAWVSTCVLGNAMPVPTQRPVAPRTHTPALSVNPRRLRAWTGASGRGCCWEESA